MPTVRFKYGVAYKEYVEEAHVIGLERKKIQDGENTDGLVLCDKGTGYLKGLDIQDSINSKPVTCIEDGAFAQTLIESVRIPSSVKTIKSNAFRDCKRLTYVIIANGLQTIENSAFRKCVELGGLLLPNSITCVKSYAFRDCENLQSISLGDNLQELGAEALRGCYSLQTVILPESLKIVGKGVFSDCSINLELIGKKLTHEQIMG